MSTRHQRGLWAERCAVFYLHLKNYRILARRCRTPLGEVDIVAARGDCLVLVEVKYRRTLHAALESISPRQQARLQRAATYLMPKFRKNSVRWDVLALAPWCWPRHIINAWEAS